MPMFSLVMQEKTRIEPLQLDSYLEIGFIFLLHYTFCEKVEKRLNHDLNIFHNGQHLVV